MKFQVLSFGLLFFYGPAIGLDQSSKVQIECQSCIDQEITANRTDLFSNDGIVLYESKIDLSGTAILNIPMSHPILLFIKIGQDSIYHLYLEPEQLLKLKICQDKVTFEGELGHVNRYLYESSHVTRKVMDEASAISGRFRKLTKEEQNSIIESYNSYYKPLHQAITEDPLIPARIKEILLDNDRFLIRWRAVLLSGIDWKRIEDESSYDAPLFFRDSPIKAAYLKANLDSYRRIIDNEIAINLQGPIYLSLKKDGKQENEDTLALITDQIIRQHTPTLQIREFLLANNITRFLFDFGFKPRILDIFENFKKDYPNSEYIKAIETRLDKHFELAEGKNAKEFTAMDANGKIFHLSDLKGKIVYIDTWATWCAPCIAEFPHSKKMIEHYKDNEDVVFLFVSVDDNADKWKTFIAETNCPKGIHVNHKIRNHDPSMYELYRMSGIPHYILIDQDGKIKVNRGPKPSERDSYRMIDSLLKQL